jgi:low temperature requirement protein LtrA
VTFAVCYSAIQVGRSAFMVWAFGLKATMGRNYAQLLAWSAIAGVVWMIGGFVHGQDARLGVWAVAALLDLSAPLHGFRLPGVDPTPISDWTLAGGHLAERCQLVLMIAFGESVLRLGDTLAHARGAAGVDAAFLVGFALTVALWSLYFLLHAEHGEEAITKSPEDSARIGRAAYAYGHGIMVGGVIVLAVGIHMAIEHPTDAVHPAFAAICIGGPALYLAGLALFKGSLGEGSVRPPLLGILAIVVLGALGSLADRLVVVVVITAVAAALAVRSQRGASPTSLLRSY